MFLLIFQVKVCLVLWALTVVTGAQPTAYVKFVQKTGSSGPSTSTKETSQSPATKPQRTRIPRSFFYSLETYDPLQGLWEDTIFVPQEEIFHYEFEPVKEHFTPDFSNGLGMIFIFTLQAKKTFYPH